MNRNLTDESAQQQSGPRVCPTGFEVYPPNFTHCPTHHVELGEQAPDTLLGSVVGSRYRICESISWGGWASIYHAVDVKTNLQVAVKVLHSHLANDNEAVSRFAREARAAADLDHPNLAHVYDAGVLPDGQPYMVMEYVPGITLADRLASVGPLTAEQAVPLFVQTADALSVAHAGGIIHRDVKPSNLIMTRGENNELQVKVVDFGLARAMHNSGVDLDQITQTGQTLGSPAYMSPEQCLGNQLDARSDIYALGCTMYEALCGHPPFEADSILEYMHKHTYEAAPPLEIRSNQANFGYNVAHVIMVSLAKNPDDRPQSMAQLRDQLQACVWQQKQSDDEQEQEPDQATTAPQPLSPPPPVVTVARPSKAVLRVQGATSTFAPVVMLILLLGLFVYVLRMGANPPPPPAEATPPPAVQPAAHAPAPRVAAHRGGHRHLHAARH